ncbi:MAG: proteasome subunit alpha, partial [Nitrospina sp.]|nr:proteasome subunit alpha [Nitrospina sp.]
NYDGHWETFKSGTVIAGNEKVMDWIQQEIQNLPFATFTLDKALEEVCRLWVESKKQQEEEKDFPQTLKEAFDQWVLEGAVLLGKVERRAIYRALTKEEIEKLKSSVG